MESKPEAYSEDLEVESKPEDNKYEKKDFDNEGSNIMREWKALEKGDCLEIFEEIVSSEISTGTENEDCSEIFEEIASTLELQRTRTPLEFEPDAEESFSNHQIQSFLLPVLQTTCVRNFLDRKYNMGVKFEKENFEGENESDESLGKDEFEKEDKQEELMGLIYEKEKSMLDEILKKEDGAMLEREYCNEEAFSHGIQLVIRESVKKYFQALSVASSGESSVLVAGSG